MENRTCCVGDCDRGGKLTRGMCAKHYRYWLDHTPPDQRGMAPRFDRRFEDYVDKSGDCWLWTGTVNRKGYGWWSGGGTRGLAHRLALAASVPCPDESLFACHRCDNPPCVNPRHLYWGTVRDNTDDMLARQGVHNKGKRADVCKRGHRIEGDNIRHVGGRDICRACDNMRSRERQRRYRKERAS